MTPILVIYAHPLGHHSVANRVLIDAARDLPAVTVRDLYEIYPDYDIDPAAEQPLIEAARLLVLQHPVYWYSVPPLLKLWLDTVFHVGWAYGPGGTALRGKDFWWVVTTGGEDESYGPGGVHERPFEAFTAPLRQTARFCGMRWLAPHVMHSARRLTANELAARAARYRTLLATYPQWADSTGEEADRD
jgi:glutathione-regulated potassium-efflux system ancillary protein KefF